VPFIVLGVALNDRVAPRTLGKGGMIERVLNVLTIDFCFNLEALTPLVDSDKLEIVDSGKLELLDLLLSGLCELFSSKFLSMLAPSICISRSSSFRFLFHRY
jgi:hypothetical protein